MDSVYSIFHPNLNGDLSKEDKRSHIAAIQEKAVAKAAQEGYVLSKEVEDFHKRKGWTTMQLKRWFSKHHAGLWCKLTISERKKSNLQLCVIGAKVWGYDMEVHLSQTGTNSKVVVVKDLTNLKVFCAVAGIGYVKATSGD